MGQNEGLWPCGGDGCLLHMTGAIFWQEGIGSNSGQRLGSGQKVGSPCRCFSYAESVPRPGIPSMSRGGVSEAESCWGHRVVGGVAWEWTWLWPRWE